ncbi:MerR family regulatory family protein 2 [Achromobacter xylosoxidans A8]|uniref:MerR family regulatory family protein 2 n=1 Tax=Achromobacter xylosoxidans (strain A8) TaxID=762376 RepID=E3HJM6_ACHXA|nr:MerR family transcriptional regulator [Achromobacter xylosoxidans]ADP14351.1 MerR family regulatory family protein 2 [Achromobacter xylosoxidans A8]
MSEYRIGDVARLTGTNISTLRLWEQHGLLVPARTETGQRIYSDADLARVSHIVRLRQINGLNMPAIRRVLEESQAAAGAVAPPPSAGAAAAAPQAREMADAVALGLRFRAARRHADLSLKEASDETSLPVSFISTFERTGRGATVASLKLLATCYGTSLTALSEASPKPSRNAAEVVRRGHEAQAPSFGAGIQILQLATSLPSLDCQKWILAPGARSEGAYAHHGEECIHVLRGEFSITVDLSAPVTLHAGDSISFLSARPHSWKVVGEEPVELFWVNTPKSF